VLFTRDLRVHDHEGLAGAAQTSGHVVPLFVLDEHIVPPSYAPNRLAFLVETLEDLRESLRKRGADLIVRRGDPVAETLRVARAVDARSVFVGLDASAYAQARERRLGLGCRSEGIELHVVNTTSVAAPGALSPGERDHYRVFTPYWRRWREAPLRPVLPAPARLRLPAALELGELPALTALTSVPPARDLPPGGEAAGRFRLRYWLARGLTGYGRDERLEVEGSSRLGPYLHFGCVSALEAVTRALGRPGGEAFVRQLCWRDFFLQLLAANPQLSTEDLRPRRAEWRRDDDALALWSEGFTGYPVVDAAMRQLAREGWLPNRARLIVASFLTKTLGFDWRHGAAVFSRLLVDADLANNVGNWQWMAGTGVDPRPNRVLNPLSQARRFDPDGAYVRRHVPELEAIDGPRVHEPWLSSPRAAAYPAPIVPPGAAPRRRAVNRTHPSLDARRA
jgi:deoxyribodipyrimidine photo-lyase